MKKYIAFNKPYGILSQFSGEDPAKTLSTFNIPKDVYPVGRLDKDSEGLLILSNDGKFINKLINPLSKKGKVYHVQVEGIPSIKALEAFREGPLIKDHKCLPCQVKVLTDYIIEPRNPPIRERKSIPTCWLEVVIFEGKNRQVRKMCAAIGNPCLRLLRVQVGKFHLGDLKQGEWIEVRRDQIL